ncbi:hypothetical protein BpHYR1_002498 [Brachionus plicatilis]|uniref:Uncharacterized protein n=1 Tax=Brachionus plicatilis TaxID=10195 RepID=A0A3M7QSE2_BRAPC|nr:hypothetical protein BpHYR1_002498 [Brachionus plicatilis]
MTRWFCCTFPNRVEARWILVKVLYRKDKKLKLSFNGLKLTLQVKLSAKILFTIFVVLDKRLMCETSDKNEIAVTR